MGNSRNVEIVNDSPGNRKEGRKRELGRKGKKRVHDLFLDITK